jgi:hypothetical protein
MRYDQDDSPLFVQTRAQHYSQQFQHQLFYQNFSDQIQIAI